MQQHYEAIRELLDRVRRRWRTEQAFSAIVRVALAASLIVLVSLLASRFTQGAPVALAIVGIFAVAALVAVTWWGLRPLRQRPDDRRVARFIEERAPSLDDRLVSAVDVATQPPSAPVQPGLAGAMVADAARRLDAIDIDQIIPAEAVRRSGFQGVAAALLALALVFSSRHVARQAMDAVSLTLFPTRVSLQVVPGNQRVKAGAGLVIEARLVGNKAPVVAQLQVASGDDWRGSAMTTSESGSFSTAMDAVWTSFKYRVVAGAVVSPTYEITAVRPPRVARIDLDYTYPSALNLPPRSESDSGDIYAPAGTDVRLHVTTDQPAAKAQMSLATGQPVPLTEEKPGVWSASLKIAQDNSYRVALADREGLSNPGDTEYFIRLLEDRPPDVRLTKPATDRSVTRLEEVEIEAQAEDDYGIDRLDFVYSVRGQEEKTVPLKIPRNASTVTGRYMFYLEDLDVEPGDFVSYYVRARDLTRGTRPNEARSDIFFLEVKPYEQQFAVAQSQTAAAGGGGRGSLDDLVAAQKEIIVATWKLDRRAQASKGAKSEQDIQSVSRAESELKERVEQTSSSFRESTMRDPRRRAPQRGGRPGPAQPELKAGQTMAEEDEMTAAAEAMTRAVASLDALKTADARGPEMEALNHLLRAQADVKKRDVVRQQAGSGAGSNRSNYDLSTLFDKELQKQQQTNYETRSSAEERKEGDQSALDKIRELAKRQDELLKRQQELARNRQQLSAEELKRELEKLTREQSDLRQKAEDLARQMDSKGSKGSEGAKGSKGSENSQGSQAAQSSQGAQGGDQAGRQMRDVSEAMRSATNDLRRQDPSQPSASSANANRALESLRNLERQMQSSQPDERRRAVGDMQLEARQLADAQRQVASELGKTAADNGGKDTVRRLAGEEERLADRARKLQDSLKQLGQSADAGKELERQGVIDRMQKSADAMRAAADRGAGPARGTTAPPGPSPGVDEARGQVSAQLDVARALEKTADRLAAAAGAPKDGESGKLSSQLARTQELQERLNQLSEEMKRLGSQGAPGGTGRDGRGQQGPGTAQGSSAAKTPGQGGRAGEGQGSGAGTGTDAGRLREEVQRAMQETRDLMEQLRRDDPSFNRGGTGFTFEGQGMTTSAPGTEAFKQDFAKWEDLRRQATLALENAQSTLSKKLQARESKERLAAGADDKAPAEYQKQVDDYFKAIAAKKKGG
ncbi:MAG TPA: DUF4175 family protein [Vicinamibacterales bacterium]